MDGYFDTYKSARNSSNISHGILQIIHLSYLIQDMPNVRQADGDRNIKRENSDRLRRQIHTYPHIHTHRDKHTHPHTHVHTHTQSTNMCTDTDKD